MDVSLSHPRDLWATRLEQIEKALARGHDPLPVQAVTERLEEGTAQPWFSENSTVVTTLYERGGVRVCEIWLAGGKLDEILEIKTQEIEPWAKEMGCNRVIIKGPKGWARLLPDYEHAGVVLMKEI